MRYLVARPRKGGFAHYWVPTPKLISAGFAITRLSDDRAPAMVEAEALNAKLDRWYRGEPEPPPGPAPGSLDALAELFQCDASFAALAERTKRDWLYSIRPALAWAGDTQVAYITRPAFKAWIRDLETRIGPGSTRNAGAALRRLLTFAVDEGWVARNIALGARLPTPASRGMVWTEAQRDAFAAAAERAGRPSMALAVLLGWCLGQRPADLRTLPWGAYDGTSVALRQAKTGTPVVIPALPELRRALDATPRRAVQIVVSEATGRPYRESDFQHVFARIRAKAGLPFGLQFRDLRRTLATALGRAGCTDDQIRAVTGHRSRSVVAVYVRPDPAYGQAAMRKLQGQKRGGS